MPLRVLPEWKLQSAKARFSEVVRAAQELGPQRVSVHGRDAVVVLSAAEYARLVPAAPQPGLHALLSRSPLRDLAFGEAGVRSPCPRRGVVRGWLLDTNVISELRKPRCDARVKAWSGGQPPASLFLSTVTIAAIRFGIAHLPAADPYRARLEAWLDAELRPWFADRLLELDEDVLLIWRRLVEKRRAERHLFPQPDLFIAATASISEAGSVRVPGQGVPGAARGRGDARCLAWAVWKASGGAARVLRVDVTGLVGRTCGRVPTLFEGLSGDRVWPEVDRRLSDENSQVRLFTRVSPSSNVRVPFLEQAS